MKDKIPKIKGVIRKYWNQRSGSYAGEYGNMHEKHIS